MMTLLHAHIEAPIYSVSGIVEVIFESILHSLKILPFLFVAFLVIEYLEHKAQDKIKHIFSRAGIMGPTIGTILGCIPQCGFSVMSANLYSSRVIALGTLIAVFLATSDEAIVLLATAPNGTFEIVKLLITKIIISLTCGYMIYFIEKKSHNHNHNHHHHHSHDICEQDHCGCEEDGKILRPALIHTGKVFGFLLLFSIILDLAVSFIGTDALSHLLLSGSALQPLLSAIIGFIPNCASSVLLSQLYIEGTLSFGALISGLCTNAGAGLLILFRNKTNFKDGLKVLLILYVCSIIPGLILHLFF